MSKTPAKISTEDWVQILKDDRIVLFHPRALEIITRLYNKPNHKAPASEIAWEMGKRGETITLSNYIKHFVIRVRKDFPFDLTVREDGSEKYWDVPFFNDTGRGEDNLFDWCLRDEMVSALKLTGLSNDGAYRDIGLASNVTAPHRTFLYTWNPLKFTTWNFEKDKKQIRDTGYVDVTWRSTRTDVSIGDHVFIMRLGNVPHKGIIASGIITGPSWISPDKNPSGSERHIVPIRLLALRDVDKDDSYIPQTSLAKLADLNWSPQAMGTLIPSDVADEVERMWLELVGSALFSRSHNIGLLSAEEGSRRDVIVSRIERDPALRKACIAHFGPICQVCKFDFGKRYGEVAEGFIHVHHHNPLSESGVTITDPIMDMSPLCPNCHAVVHLKTPPFTIKEMKIMYLSNIS